MFPFGNLKLSSDSIYQKLLEYLRTDGRVQDITTHYTSIAQTHHRVLYVYNLIKIYKLLPLVIKEDKCEFTSQHYRNLGNKMFERKKFYRAWQYYNLALMYSPLDSSCYVLAISNRSAVLASIKEYRACLEDIRMVFSVHCPPSIRDKLIKRKKLCKEAIEAAQNGDSAEEKEQTEEIFTFKGSKHEKYIDASSKLAVKHTRDMGRHVIAVEDIEVGEILVQESPYVSLLLRDQIIITCAHCLSRKFNLYPCPYCCMTMYCSRECVDAAWEAYHYYECPCLASLLDNKFTKLELLALRTTIRARTLCKSWEEVLDTVEKVEACTNADDIGCHQMENGNLVYSSEHYESIHSLATNVERRDISDLFQKTVSAAVLLHYLGMKNFIPSTDPVLKKKIRKFTANTLMRHLMTAPTNMHSISANVEDDDGNYVDEYEIGSGAYAFLSLINHSCAPNVVRYTRLGTTQTTLFALRPIKKGMQIFDNYGYMELLEEEENMMVDGIYKNFPNERLLHTEMASCGITKKAHHAVNCRENRQAILRSQYKFTCVCEACTKEWPMYDGLSTIRNYPAAIAKKIEYLNGDVFHALQKGNKKRARMLFKPLCELATALEPYIPCKDAADCQEAVKQCLAILSGVLSEGFTDYVEWGVPAPRRAGRPMSSKFFVATGTSSLLEDMFN